MFTGIIEETGTVLSVQGGRAGAVLDIAASKVLEDTAAGDSIAVNGVCLTVTPGHGHFTADVMPESLRRTSLGSLTAGSKVNLERAMQCGGRFGGHIVSGHVDACGRVERLEHEGIALLMTVSVPAAVMKYIAIKGSVTLDGVSLTVADAMENAFTVSLIPHTLGSTALGLLRTGSPVNVEADMLARYLEQLLRAGDGLSDSRGGQGSGLTADFLKENGF